MNGMDPDITELQKACNAVVNMQLDAFRYTHIAHPLDAPFIRAMLLARVPWETISRLWNECGRKYEMGAKRGIAKWGLRELIAQYTEKLGLITGSDRTYESAWHSPVPAGWESTFCRRET